VSKAHGRAAARYPHQLQASMRRRCRRPQHGRHRTSPAVLLVFRLQSRHRTLQRGPTANTVGFVAASTRPSPSWCLGPCTRLLPLGEGVWKVIERPHSAERLALTGAAGRAREGGGTARRHDQGP